MAVEQVKDFFTFLRRNAFIYYYLYLPFQVLRTDRLRFREKLGIIFSGKARAKAMNYLVYDYCAQMNPLEKLIVQTIPLVVGKNKNGMEYVKEDSIVIDVGANLGIFSVFVSQYCPKGHVYAFEPVPSLINLLEGFRRVSGTSNLEIVERALGDEVTSQEIIVYDDSAGVSTLSEAEHASRVEKGLVSGFRKEQVQITTLDTFVEERGLDRVDFVKIDTEGYELKILEGAAETIRRFRPVIIAQNHYSVSIDQIRDLLNHIVKDYSFTLERENAICETLIAVPSEVAGHGPLARHAERP